MNKEQIAFSKGYRVTKEGNCVSPKGKLLKLVFSNPYLRFSIKNEGKVLTVKVHRLQAYQKFGDGIYDEGIVVRHLNGNYLDNSWDDIEIGSDSDNMLDIPEEVRVTKASNAGKVYSDELVDSIKAYKKTHTYAETMKEYNISSKGTLYYILNNR